MREHYAGLTHKLVRAPGSPLRCILACNLQRRPTSSWLVQHPVQRVRRKYLWNTPLFVHGAHCNSVRGRCVCVRRYDTHSMTVDGCFKVQRVAHARGRDEQLPNLQTSIVLPSETAEAVATFATDVAKRGKKRTRAERVSGAVCGGVWKATIDADVRDPEVGAASGSKRATSVAGVIALVCEHTVTHGITDMPIGERFALPFSLLLREWTDNRRNTFACYYDVACKFKVKYLRVYIDGRLHYCGANMAAILRRHERAPRQPRHCFGPIYVDEPLHRPSARGRA